MTHLNQEQRYQIYALFLSGISQKEIAFIAGCSPSTVSRELRRNADKKGLYKPEEAHLKAKARVKKKEWKFTEAMKTYILGLLEKYHSPEQIWGRAKLEGIVMVSIETIYKWIYAQIKLGASLKPFLRWHLAARVKRALSNKKRGQIPDRVLIDDRPEIVEKRERLGDFEVDLVIGKGHHKAILTVVDRASRMLYAALLDNKEAATVTTKLLYILVNKEVKTITSDNGKEFAGHKEVAQTLQASYYFAHPYHSWERGSNENANGLLRQFVPKNRPFDDLTEEQLQKYVDNINNRPRKIHGFKSSIEIFQEKSKLTI